MNSKMKSLMLPYMMLASGALNPEVDAFSSMEGAKIISRPEWERKKCKSCKFFPCNNSKNLYKSNPLSQACSKYEKRK